MIVMGESMVSCNFTGNQSNEIALGGSPSFRQTNVAETSSWLWKKGWWKCETRVPTVAREVFKDVKLHVPLAVIPKHSTFRMIPPPRASYASDLGQKYGIAEVPESQEASTRHRWAALGRSYLLLINESSMEFPDPDVPRCPFLRHMFLGRSAFIDLMCGRYLQPVPCAWRSFRILKAKICCGASSDLRKLLRSNGFLRREDRGNPEKNETVAVIKLGHMAGKARISAFPTKTLRPRWSFLGFLAIFQDTGTKLKVWDLKRH